jgi:hypothetical protein
MGLITLCPPAIALGADVNLMTRAQVQRERRDYYQMWGPQGLRLPDKWLPELDAFYCTLDS